MADQDNKRIPLIVWYDAMTNHHTHPTMHHVQAGSLNEVIQEIAAKVGVRFDDVVTKQLTPLSWLAYASQEQLQLDDLADDRDVVHDGRWFASVVLVDNVSARSMARIVAEPAPAPPPVRISTRYVGKARIEASIMQIDGGPEHGTHVMWSYTIPLSYGSQCRVTSTPEQALAAVREWLDSHGVKS